MSLEAHDGSRHRVAQDYILDNLVYPDLERFESLLSSDVVLIRNVNNQLMVIRGKENVFAFYKAELCGVTDRLFESFTNSSIGDLMIIDFFGEYKNTDLQRIYMHEHTALWLKQIDGVWLIAEIMTNIHRSPPF